MAPLDYRLADALGVNRWTRTDVIARALLQAAGRDEIAGNIPPKVADFLLEVAEELGHYLPDVDGTRREIVIRTCVERSAEAVTRSVSWDGPRILAFLAPEQEIPRGPAKSLRLVCRALVRHQVRALCFAVLTRWKSDRLIQTVEPDDIPDDEDTAYADHPAGDYYEPYEE